MHPYIFKTVATRTLINERDDKVNEGLINLVSLMYENVYNNKDKYNRLPSCSEMLIALEDPDRLLKCCNAPKHIIYNVIVKNMFKSSDDRETFESILNKSENSKLKNLINSMKDNKQEDNEVLDLNELIKSQYFIQEKTMLEDKKNALQQLIDEYKEKFAKAEEARKTEINDKVNNIKLQDGELVQTNRPNAISLFQDETKRIKRGYNIFNLSNSDWTYVGTIRKNNLYYQFFLSKLIEHINELDITLYENGILLENVSDYKLIVTCDFKQSQANLEGTSFNNDIEFNIYFNHILVPDLFLSDILYFSDFINDCYEAQPKTVGAINDEVIGFKDHMFIDALVYSDLDLGYDHVMDKASRVMDKVSHVSIRNLEDLKKLSDLIENNNSTDIEKVNEASTKLLEGKSKVLKK